MFGYRNLGFGGGKFVEPAAYDIPNSMRFEDGDSPYLSITPGSASNRTTWTWSGWVKRGNLGTHAPLLCSGSDRGTMRFNVTTDVLRICDFNADYNLITTQVFRDSSAWYHIVVAMDTTQSTASNRTKLYVNGTQVTAFSTETYPDQNLDTQYNLAQVHYIGTRERPSPNNLDQKFDGYMAEVHFIDGTALTPSSFGEAGDYGEWKPKEVSGVTYGTNGFYLDFKLSATGTGGIGKDQSGNGNDMTTSGLAVTDQMLDSPTNNFCTMNPINSSTSGTFTYTEGNLITQAPGTSWVGTMGTFAPSTGKWYWEVEFDAGSTQEVMIGVIDISVDHSTNLWTQPGTLFYYNNNGGELRYYNSGGLINTTADYGLLSAGDILSISLNLDDMEISFAINNSTVLDAFDFDIDNMNTILPTALSDSSDVVYKWNFGADSSFAGGQTAGNNADGNGYGDFIYAPPSGFLALCTKNMAAPAVIPSEYFNTVLYTGDQTDSSKGITGVGFQPDLVWGKNRSSTSNHWLFDTVRDATKMLSPDSSTVEEDQSGVTAFDSDGFTLGDWIGSTKTDDSYVAWNWKINGGTVSNVAAGDSSNIRLVAAGTADQASVQVNTDVGISIISFENTVRAADGFCTFPHGLGSVPDMIWLKSRDSANYWAMYHISEGLDLGFLGGDGIGDDAFVSSTFWNTITSSTVKFQSNGNLSATDEDIIVYCFKGIEGYSKMGSYVGNGNADGPFVYTGFRPAYVTIKRTDAVDDWNNYDSTRSNTGNPINESLYLNTTGAEGANDTGHDADFLSNGLKLRNTNAQENASGGTYIYMAWADVPFKYATAF